MTLSIIGLGLWNENSMTLEALEEAKKCDKLYAEFYTCALIGASMGKLEEKFGKKIEVLKREDVEQTTVIVEDAKEQKVGFLVAGDCLTATTHIDLLLQAEEAGIETRVVHGTSIYSAGPGLAGLQHYKFGKSTSIPYPAEGFKPESHYDILKENKSIGAHTLVFLDIQPPKYMTANEGMKILLEVEEKRKENVFTGETRIVVVARAGSEKPLVKTGKVKELLDKDFGGAMHTIIVPGKLHFKEEEALVRGSVDPGLRKSSRCPGAPAPRIHGQK